MVSSAAQVVRVTRLEVQVVSSLVFLEGLEVGMRMPVVQVVNRQEVLARLLDCLVGLAVVMRMLGVMRLRVERRGRARLLRRGRGQLVLVR